MVARFDCLLLSRFYLTLNWLLLSRFYLTLTLTNTGTEQFSAMRKDSAKRVRQQHAQLYRLPQLQK
jgi:hypothetical protein